MGYADGHRWPRLAARLLLVGAPFSALAVTGGAAPGDRVAVAATPGTLTATPSTNLRDQAVTVRWANFPKTNPTNRAKSVVLYQCTAAPQSVSDCFTAPDYPNVLDGNAVTDRTTAKDGTGTAEFLVRTDDILPSLGCNISNPCSIVALLAGHATPADVQAAPRALLSFGPNPNTCPQVSTFNVRAEGSSPAARAMSNWIGGACALNPPLLADNTELSSPRGRQDFLAGQVNMGLTSMPATADELAAAPSHRPFTYVPVDADPVVVAFNIWDAKSQTPITDMKLTPRLLAIILADSANNNAQGSFYSDPEFLAANPNHSWPTGHMAPPLVRAELNADTRLLTTWLAQDAGVQQFLAGKDPNTRVDDHWKNVRWPTDNFDARANDAYLPRNGTTAIIKSLYFGVTAVGNIISPSQNGMIAITDLASAKAYGLPSASLENAAKQFVAPDAAGLAAGYADMTANPDAVTTTANLSTTDPAAYPLPKIDYAMAPIAGITPQLGRDLVRFLTYATATGQGPDTLPPGYFPLTDAMRAVAARQMALIPAPPAGRHLHFDASMLSVAATPATAPTPVAAPTSTTVPPQVTAVTAAPAVVPTAPAVVPTAPAPLTPASDSATPAAALAPAPRPAPVAAPVAVSPRPVASVAPGSSPPARAFQAITRLFAIGQGRLLLPILLLVALAAAVGAYLLLHRRWRPLVQSLRH